MAGPLKVEFIGDVSKLDRAAGDGEDRLSRFDSNVGGMGGGLGALGGKAALMGTAVVAGTAIAGAAVVGLAGLGVAKLAELGDGFDGLGDAIRIGTGKTGEALEGLQTQALGQFTSLPVSMDDAGAAVARLGKGLGLTGGDLDTMSKQVLNLSRITGEDLGGTITDTRSVLNNWGVDAAAMPGVLDTIFRATQLTDTTFGDLAGSLTSSGLQLRELGFGIDESTALLAQLANAGVEAGDVMPGFKKVIGEAAENGKDASTAFAEFFAIVKNSPNDTAAAQYAVEQLGAKAGPQLAALIRDGRLDYQGLLEQIRGGSDTINAAAEDTDDWSQKLEVLKNRGLVALKPAADAVFSGINVAVDTVAPYVDRLLGAFGTGGLAGGLTELGNIGAEVWPLIQSGLGQLRDSALVWWDQNKEAIGQGLLAGLKWGVERLADLRNLALDKLAVLIPAIGEWVQNTAVPAIEANWQSWLEAFVGWITPLAQEANARLGAFLSAVGGWFVSDFLPWALQKGREWSGALLEWLATEAAPAALRALGDLLASIGGWVTGTGGPGLMAKGAELRDSFLSWLSELPGKALEAGGNLISGLWEGLRGKLGEILGGFDNALARPLVNALKSAFGIQSPSRLTMEIGEQLAAGMAVGVGNGMGQVNGAFALDPATGDLRSLSNASASSSGAAFPDRLTLVLETADGSTLGEFVVGAYLAGQAGVA